MKDEIAQAYVRIRAKRVNRALMDHKQVLRNRISRYIWHHWFSRLSVPQISLSVLETKVSLWVRRRIDLPHSTIKRFVWHRRFSRKVVRMLGFHEQAMRARW